MKKKSVIILGAVLVFALVIVIIALSGGSDSELKGGTYKLIDASGSGSEMFKATSGDVTLTFDDNGEGTLTMLDQTTDVAVDFENSKISFDGGITYTSYIWKDGKLTVENGGYKAVFKKK